MTLSPKARLAIANAAEAAYMDAFQYVMQDRDAEARECYLCAGRIYAEGGFTKSAEHMNELASLCVVDG